VRAPGYRAGRTMYWLSWVAGIVTLAGLWGVLSSVLADQVARLTGQG
ncbi:TPA: DotU family type IV/VI secretion system protein, partial [Escherichia coli]|nr:DotU family type IV/VI secretion system protein [Escherichia coli]